MSRILLVVTAMVMLIASDTPSEQRIAQVPLRPEFMNRAQLMKPKPKPAPRIPQTGLVLADQHHKTTGNNQFMRYLWSFADDPTEDYIAAVVTLNSVQSRSATPYLPEFVMGGAIIPVDLSQLADTAEDLEQLVQLWDSMAEGEPYFHATIRNRKVQVKPYVAADGKTYDFVIEKGIGPAPYLNATFSPGFIYRADWFIRESLSSVDGGHYLRFRGINPGVTKLRDYLRSRGADLDEADLRNVTEKAVMRSKITGRKRTVLNYQGSTLPPTKGQSIISITGDIFKGTDDPEYDPVANLINPRQNGHETILKLPNGFLEFSLWNEQEVAVAVAPDDLASDSSVPSEYGFDHRLHGAISCIRCHAGEGGWRTYTNQIKAMIPAVLTDFTGGDQFGAYRKILSLYNAENHEIDKLLSTLRQDLDELIYRCTKNLGDSRRVGAVEAFEITSKVYNRYQYPYITPEVAAKELGLQGDIISILGQVPPGKVESHWILELQTGVELDRREWEQVYQLAMTRALKVHEAKKNEPSTN